jgi:type I restriction enzyme R subunit
VDESHPTQFGSFSALMRQMFPQACYLGFTGTSLLKKEKNNFTKFGERKNLTGIKNRLFFKNDS